MFKKKGLVKVFPIQLAQYGVAILAIGGVIWLLYKVFVPKQTKQDPDLYKIIAENAAAFRDNAAASRELIEIIRQQGTVMAGYGALIEKQGDMIQKQSEYLTELRIEIARKEKIQ
jgi:hypothetical protein